LPDDGRTFVGDPDLRFVSRVVGVAAVLPLPSKTAGFSGVNPEHPPVQRIHCPAVFTAVPQHLRHA
jgi:hypothetical protein